jgi:hypothetical protein
MGLTFERRNNHSEYNRCDDTGMYTTMDYI